MDQSVRRIVPFALLALLLTGVLSAALAGQLSSPSARASATTTAPPTSSAAKWVANLLATTARAGSAHFAYVHVTASPNPVVRGTITGSGAVNFTAGTVRVNEVEQQVELVPRGGLFQPHTGQQPPQNEVVPARTAEQPSRSAVSMIGVGRTTYESMSGSNGDWLRLALPRNPRAQLGLQYAVNASVALGGLEGLEPIAAVHAVGRATLERGRDDPLPRHQRAASVWPDIRHCRPSDAGLHDGVGGRSRPSRAGPLDRVHERGGTECARCRVAARAREDDSDAHVLPLRRARHHRCASSRHQPGRVLQVVRHPQPLLRDNVSRSYMRTGAISSSAAMCASVVCRSACIVISERWLAPASRQRCA